MCIERCEGGVRESVMPRGQKRVDPGYRETQPRVKVEVAKASQGVYDDL